MKKLLLTAVAMMVALGAFAQGTVNLQNNNSSLVYLDALGGTRAPAGSTYNVAIYYAPDGTTAEDAFVMVGNPAGFSTSFALGGVFVGGTRTVPTATPGGFAQIQVRGWETAYGTSYESVYGTAGRVGKSNILRIDTGDPTTVPPGSATSLTAGTAPNALTPFVLAVVPEPSAIALGVLGAGALLLLRRRK